MLLLAGIAAAFFGLLVTVVPKHALTEVLNGVFLGIVGAVTVVFFPLFLRSLRAREFDRVSQLTMGIILTWFSLILSRILSVYINATSPAMREVVTPLIAFVTYLAILGGILHITAPGMVEEKWKYNKGLLAVALVIGLLIAAVAVYVQRTGLPSI